jgi:hypothetical protein
MKQLNTTEGMKQLSHEEAMAVTGGTLFRTFLLGPTIFGMARLTGLMTGYASI